MPDSRVQITEGSGLSIDTRTESTNSQHRQVIVIGDPSANDAVGAVVSADPGATSTAYGAVVRLAGSATVTPAGGTFRVFLDSATGLPAGTNTLGSIAVFFSPSNPSVNIGSSSLAVYFSASNPAVNVTNATLGVYLSATAGTIVTKFAPETGLPAGSNTIGSVAVFYSPANPTVTANAGTGTFAVFFSPANPAVNVSNGSINVYLGATAGTLVVKLAPETGLPAGSNTLGSIGVFFSPSNPTVTANVGTGSSAVYFSSSNPKVTLGTDIVNVSHTAIIPQTVTGSVSSQGGSGLNTLISPESGRVIKVYAYSITTTGQVNNNVRFTNGSTGGGGELWRLALEAPAQGIAGANLAVTPPGYLFAGPTNSTIALYLGEASLVHYSLAYFKETS